MKSTLRVISFLALAAQISTAQNVHLDLNDRVGPDEFVLKNTGSEPFGLLGVTISSMDGGLSIPELGGPLFQFTLPSTPNMVTLGNLGAPYVLEPSARVGTGITYSGSSRIFSANFEGSSFGHAGGTEAFGFYPEPSGALMAWLGLMGLLACRRRSRS